jgi:nitronate monooxygenase
MDLLDRLGLERPVVQAGMGGGLATAPLAAAVSSAGGLGTVGILPPSLLRSELRRAVSRSGGRPVAANLIVPFLRRPHVDAVIDGGASLCVLSFGFHPWAVARLRSAGVVVLHQVGTVEEALRGLRDGADGLIAQGREAGGHLVGVEPMRDFLPRAVEVAVGRPVLAAGGIHDAAGARAALGAGAVAVVAGTSAARTRSTSSASAARRRPSRPRCSAWAGRCAIGSSPTRRRSAGCAAVASRCGRGACRTPARCWGGCCPWRRRRR